MTVTLDACDPMAVGPVEAQLLRELAVAAAIEPVALSVPGCDGALRVLRGGTPTPAGHVVVLLHGRGHAAAMWFPALGPLAARAPVLAVDLPGFGGSGTPPLPARGDGAAGGLRFFVEPVEALLAGEVAAGRARGFVLVGHSLGGLVSIELALRGRVPVSRLVLIDAMGVGPLMTGQARIFFRLHPERLAAMLGRRLFERLNPPAPTSIGQRVAALEHELFTAAGCAAARRAAARAFDRLAPLTGPVFNRGEQCARLTVSTLLLWGQRDVALPVENATLARMRLPASELVVFPTLGHSPHLEAPEVVLPRLMEVI